MERNVAVSADVIDVADILRSVRNGLWLVAASIAIAVAIAFLIITFVPPSFVGRASLILRTGTAAGPGSGFASAISAMNDASGGGGAAASLAGLKSATETEIDILTSRTLAGQIVDSLRLQALVGKPRSTPATAVFASTSLPGSFRKRAYVFTRDPANAQRYEFRAKDDSGSAIIGQPASLSMGTITLGPGATATSYRVTFLDREDAITRVVENLDFEKLKTDVAHFEYAASDSLTAAAVPNLLMRLYLERRKGQDRGVNQRRAEFLAQKVDSVNEALTAAERALRLTRESTGLLDPAQSGRLEVESESRLRSQLTEFQSQEAALQQLVTQISSGQASARQLAAYPQYLSSGPINGLVGSLIAIETERQGLLMTRTEQDQDVRALAERAKNLEGQLLPLAKTTLAAISTQRGSLESRLARLRENLLRMPADAEAFGRHEREIMERSRIYAGLQAQLVEARLAAISEGGDVRPLDQAIVPKRPSPRPVVVMAAGTGLGVFAGLILAVLAGIVGGRMHDAEDVERRTGLPAVRYDTTAPLLVGSQTSRTVLVAPISPRAAAGPVAQRLVETAMSRSMSATLLDLSRSTNGTGHAVLAMGQSADGFDANGAIRRLEASHDLVVVQLPAVNSREAASVLDPARPVLLVVPERRIERRGLQGAIDLLRRVGAPCAGVVLHGDDRRTLRG